MKVKRSTVVKTLTGLYRFVQFPWTQILAACSLRTSFLRPSYVTETEKKRNMERVVIGVPVFSPT